MTESLQRCQCGATWIGHIWQRCNYCAVREEQKLQDYRRKLLYPDWLQDQGPKYWELDDSLREVWNVTRGLKVHDDVVMAWAIALEQAVEDEVITRLESLGALDRWQLTQLKNTGKLTNSESNTIQR